MAGPLWAMCKTFGVWNPAPALGGAFAAQPSLDLSKVKDFAAQLTPDLPD